VFQKTLAGYSADLLRKTTDATNFYDVRNPQFGNLSQHDVVRNNDQTSLNDSLPLGWSGRTIHGGGGSAVLLPGDWFNQSDAADSLLHELLHALTKVGDNELFKIFAPHGLSRTQPGTKDITDWLGRDCKK
jgi:hypothetical protein